LFSVVSIALIGKDFHCEPFIRWNFAHPEIHVFRKGKVGIKCSLE